MKSDFWQVSRLVYVKERETAQNWKTYGMCEHYRKICHSKTFPLLHFPWYTSSRMYCSLFASVFVFLKLTFAIPLQTDDTPATNTFSSFENLNLFDATMSLEPDPKDDSFLSSVEYPASDLAPTSFIADDNGNIINDDFQLLLSTEPDLSCPAEKRKRDVGVCDSAAKPRVPQIPNILDSAGWGEDSQTQANPFEGLGDDPCLFRIGYPTHVCCRGPPGQLIAGEYLTIENCYMGKFFLFEFFARPSKVRSQTSPQLMFSFVFLVHHFFMYPWPFPIQDSRIRNDWLF